MVQIHLLTGAQVRMAKAALGWSNTDLAKMTGLHKNTINRAENDLARDATLALLKITFEAAGIEFIAEGETPQSGGTGVLLKK